MSAELGSQCSLGTVAHQLQYNSDPGRGSQCSQGTVAHQLQYNFDPGRSDCSQKLQLTNCSLNLILKRGE